MSLREVNYLCKIIDIRYPHHDFKFYLDDPFMDNMISQFSLSKSLAHKLSVWELVGPFLDI